MSNRVLLLSWEYPPVIEGGLARHVRKLAEALVRQGVAVDVLTRGIGEESESGGPRECELGGVNVHRVREPSWPRDLDRFLAWVEQMNDDMLAAGEALARGALLRPRTRPRLARRACLRRARRPARRALYDDDPRDRARAPPGVGAGSSPVADTFDRALDGPAGRCGGRVLLLHARTRGRHLRHR